MTAASGAAHGLLLQHVVTSDGRRRTVDGPRDVGLTPDRAAELFFRDIMASIEQGEDR